MVTMVREIMTAPVDRVDGVDGVVNRFDAVPAPPSGGSRPSGSAIVRDV